MATTSRLGEWASGSTIGSCFQLARRGGVRVYHGADRMGALVAGR